MDAHELKLYIFENDKIEDILKDLDCVHITPKPTEFRCGLPNDYNPTRISLKRTESLSVTIYKSTDAVVRGDIITLVMEIKSLNFINSMKYLHEFLGLSYTNNKKSKDEVKTQSPIDIFKKVKKRHRTKFDISEIETFDESILGEYVPNLTKEWLSEGIISKTAREFGIMYDYNSRRIIIPHYSYLTGEIIGIVGRTTIPNFDLLGIPKYLHLKPYPKGMNLYGLSHNYDGIIKAGYVVVGEGEKHVLKRHSRLDRTCTSIGSHDITDEQVKIIMGLDITEVVFAMDKGISEQHVWMMCEKLWGVKNVSYIWDKYDILADKESPADKPDKIYNWLFKHRVKYDESKRREYKKYLEQQEEERKGNGR